ncbi:MAG: ribosome maturation factor RimP [Pseudonocardia sp.]
MPRPQPEQLSVSLRPTVERAVSSIGFDLEEIEIRQAGRRALVRVVVDAEDGVGLDDIASLSRRVAAELDEQDEVLGGPYTLEVTSPGVDRPLTQPRHWRRAHLRSVEITLGDRGVLTGRVGQAGDASVQVLVDGVVREVRYTEVERAVVLVEFRQPPAAELRALSACQNTPGPEDGPAGESAATRSKEQR